MRYLGTAPQLLVVADGGGSPRVLMATQESCVDVASVLGVPQIDVAGLLNLSLSTIGWSELLDALTRADGTPRTAMGDHHVLQAPVPPDAQIWASGVTYERSREARADESGSDIYASVYAAERPELFFKARGIECIGGESPVCIRGDSAWQVPEPELVLVLNARLDVVGISLGNDLTARDLEATNPLYLPQAKMWPGSCAIGPGFVPTGPDLDIAQLEISCSIERGDEVVWKDEISLSKLNRRVENLVRFMRPMHGSSESVWLLTGTGLVPPNTVSLKVGDVIEVHMPEVGVLRNVVSVAHAAPTELGGADE